MFAFTTQGRFLLEKCSPLPMLGRATFTIDASKITTNCATASRINAIHHVSAEAKVHGRGSRHP